MSGNYPGNVIGRRQCPCGCSIWFNVTTRSPHKVCLNRSHASAYSARKVGRQEEHQTRRREKFAQMVAALVKPGQPLKQSQLVDLCDETWQLGYYAGHRVGKGAPARKAKRAERTQVEKVEAA